MENELVLLNATWSHFEDHIGFYIDGNPFCPIIDELQGHSDFAKGCNTVLIPIDAGLTAELNWENARKIARKAIDEGLYILWDIRLDLFASTLALSDSPQYLALQLALDHFKETLWNEFASHTLGACLYRGSIDLTSKWLWKESECQQLREWFSHRFESAKFLGCPTFNEITPDKLRESSYGLHYLRQHCLELFIDYLTLLMVALPVEVLPFIAFDLTKVPSQAEQLQLLSLESLNPFHLILKGAIDAFPSITWGDNSCFSGYLGTQFSSFAFQNKRKAGILLPSSANYFQKPYENIVKFLHQVEKGRSSFKTIPEEALTMQWDGVELLFVEPSGLSMAGKRMLHGFCAAGGRVVSLGEPLGVADELSLFDWLLES